MFSLRQQCICSSIIQLTGVVNQECVTSLQVAYMRRLATAIDTSNRESSPHREQQQQHSAVYRCNGVFFACFQTTHIWGNLVSSLLLSYGVTTQHGGAVGGQYDDIYSAADGTGAYCGTYDTCNSLQPVTSLMTVNISGTSYVYRFLNFEPQFNDSSNIIRLSVMVYMIG